MVEVVEVRGGYSADAPTSSILYPPPTSTTSPNLRHPRVDPRAGPYLA